MTAPDPLETLPTNWGRWGAADERGTLNLVTDEARARGVAEARVGRTVSLAFPVGPGPLAGPVPFGTGALPGGVMQLMAFTGSPARALTDVLVVNTHHAAVTHIDALAHIPVGDRVYPGVPLAEAVSGGTVRHGSTTAFAEGVTTRGVLLDLAPEGRLEAGREVTDQDLDAAEERAGVRLESGDALVVRAGRRLADHLGEPVPFVGTSAVRWMAEREVSLYAGDIGDPPPVPPAGPMALHQVALARLGMPLIDNPDVEPLARACRELGPVLSSPSAPRRPARHLAARPNHPGTSSTRMIRPRAEAPHRTPRGRPPGDDGELNTGPRPSLLPVRGRPGGRHRRHRTSGQPARGLLTPAPGPPRTPHPNRRRTEGRYPMTCVPAGTALASAVFRTPTQPY